MEMEIGGGGVHILFSITLHYPFFGVLFLYLASLFFFFFFFFSIHTMTFFFFFFNSFKKYIYLGDHGMNGTEIERSGEMKDGMKRVKVSRWR